MSKKACLPAAFMHSTQLLCSHLFESNQSGFPAGERGLSSEPQSSAWASLSHWGCRLGWCLSVASQNRMWSCLVSLLTNYINLPKTHRCGKGGSEHVVLHTRSLKHFWLFWGGKKILCYWHSLRVILRFDQLLEIFCIVPLKSLGEKPWCLCTFEQHGKWLLSVTLCSPSEQPWEAGSLISGHAPVWHFHFKWNHKAQACFREVDDTTECRVTNQSTALTATGYTQSHLWPENQVLPWGDEAGVTSIYRSVFLQQQERFI